MYSPWLQPPSIPPGDFADFTLGKRLIGGRPSRKITVALIGMDVEIATKTREHLYQRAWDFGQLGVGDLGDLRKQTPDFVIPLLREIHAGHILPILMGADPVAFSTQYLAFAELNRQVGLLQLDQDIRLSVLDQAIERSSPPSFHIAHMGAQQHLLDPGLYHLFASKNFEMYRLGAAKADLSQLEPTVRDADLIGIDISCIQYAEAPAQTGYHPSGFSLQEAGQLAFYAGNSDKLSSFGVYGLDRERSGEAQELTVAAYAQLIWYFLYGISKRSGDFPVSTQGMLEYVVDTKVADRLTFWRSPRTNRWWVQVPAGKYHGEERNRLIACSYQDYLNASQEGDLPERLVNAFSRH